MAKKDVLRDISCTRWKKMKNRTIFSKKKWGQPKVAIQLCHLEEEGGDPVHQLAGWLIHQNCIFTILVIGGSISLFLFFFAFSSLQSSSRAPKTEDALATLRNGFPCKFTNMGLKTPTCAHGTFKPGLYPPWGEWPPSKTSQAFFTPYAMPPWEWPRLATPANHRKQPWKHRSTRSFPFHIPLPQNTWPSPTHRDSERLDEDRNAD
mgnify:CR=1 FL=1